MADGMPQLKEETPPDVVAQAAADAKTAADSGDWDGARAAMSRAIDAAPTTANFHALMAWYTFQCSTVSLAFERQRIAEHHINVALEIDPDNAQAHYCQGLIWAGGGNTTRARIALSTALKTRPDFQAAAQALDKLGKVNEPEPVPELDRPVAKSRPSVLIPLALATVLVAAGGGAALYFS